MKKKDKANGREAFAGSLLSLSTFTAISNWRCKLALQIMIALQIEYSRSTMKSNVPTAASPLVSSATVTYMTDNDENTDTRMDPKISSLDFEKIVNQYSIQSVRDQYTLPPLPVDGEVTARNCRSRKYLERSSSEIEAGMGKIKTAHRVQPRHLLGYTGKKATRWFLTCLAGLLTGLASVLIIKISGSLVSWRSRNLQDLIFNPAVSDSTTFLIFSALNLIEALLACWLCIAWVPQAAGSGISRVKAYLNGIRDDQNFVASIPVFIVKVVGTILSVSSGLAVGQEGPLIHIGAIMGSGCSRISGVTSRYLNILQHPSNCCCCIGTRSSDHDLGNSSRRFLQGILSWTTTQLTSFATHAERHDFVSIGASVGFAASFGAPVGGLLFMLDDISSYFTKSLILRILVANVIGTFCLAVQHGDFSNYSVINLGSSETIVVSRLVELPLFILTGIIFGVLGGLFCKMSMFLRRNIAGRNPRSEGPKKLKKLLEVALVSLVTSIVLFTLPMQEWVCTSKQGGDNQEASSYASDFSSSTTKRFFCDQGEVNELANVLFGSRIEAIKRILTDPTQFQQATLLTVGISFYVLMTLATYGLAIPAGIFTPTVLIGASLGGAAGVAFQNHVDSDITPSTFALLGVAGLLAGIQRSTVSVAIILVEGTGKIKVLMPAIVTVVISRYVASLIYKDGIFEALMHYRGVPYLDHEANKPRYDAIECGEIMSDCPLVSVGPIETVKRIVEVLQETRHNGFPVICPKTNKFLGLVRRDQLAALLECGAFQADPLWKRPQVLANINGDFMRWAYNINDDRYDYLPVSSDISEPSRMIVEKAQLQSVKNFRDLQLAEYSSLPTEFAKVVKDENGLVRIAWFDPDYEDEFVNIGAVMNRGAFVVTEFCPVSKAYSFFTSMGLRHLTVLGGNSGEVVGMLTRSDLLPNNIKATTGM